MMKNRRLYDISPLFFKTGVIFLISQLGLSLLACDSSAHLKEAGNQQAILHNKTHLNQNLPIHRILTQSETPYFLRTPSWIEAHDELAAQTSNSLIAEANEPIKASKESTQQLLPSPEPIGPVINFNNVSIIEYLRFISRLTGKNFIFDEQDLNFNVTIISESPTTLDMIMAALLQNLKVHSLQLIEQGNNYLIHSNSDVKGPASLSNRANLQNRPQLVTQVFHLINVPCEKIANIIKPLLSEDTEIEYLEETNLLVITDLAYNIKKISELIKNLDAPEPGFDIGQYVAENTSLAALTLLAQKILSPIAKERPLTLVPHPASNSIFVVSSPYLVERALSVMKTLDNNESESRILNFDKLHFDSEQEKKDREARSKKGGSKRKLDRFGRPIESDEDYVDRDLHDGSLDKRWTEDLPIGELDSTQFYLYRLQYRKSLDVAKALRAIATSLNTAAGAYTNQSGAATANSSDLVTTLNSVQPIEDNNSLVITGTRVTIEKTKELISQIDTPVKQVFIEMLVLDTTVSNSLNFGVEWAGTIQRPSLGAGLGLIGPNTMLKTPFEALTLTTPNPLSPVPLQEGVQASSIGRHITFKGKGFISTGALIKALSKDVHTNVVMNPKITTEHNVQAEIFVGTRLSFRGQSIVNQNGDLVTQNYDFRSVGHSLKVTPLIGNNNIVTLIIDQYISELTGNTDNNDNEETRETKNIARVHLPSDCFLVMSGILQERTKKTETRVPCLGALPVIGGLFKNEDNDRDKRNVIIFVRPHIVGNEQDMEIHTRRQEEIFKEKCKPDQTPRNEWSVFLDYLNL